MDSFRDDYGLSGFFGDFAVPDSDTIGELSDWTTLTSGDGGDGRLYASTTTSIGGQLDAGLSTSLPVFMTSDFLPQHEVFFPEQNVSLDSSGFSANDMPPLETSDVPLMDILWPELAQPAFDPELWKSSFSLDLSPSNLLPPVNPSSAPVSSQTHQEGSDEGSRKKRRRIPPDAKRLLDECFERHRDDPYVPPDRIKGLASVTGLTVRQVRTFFANARARKLPREPDSQSPVSAQESPKAGPTESQDVQQDPMERFLSSSPEDEGISEDAVRTAAGSMTRPTFTTHRRHSSLADAISVSDSAVSSTSASDSSAASVDSVNSRGARRGRKRRREPTKVVTSITRKPSSPSRKYQCTFCTQDFAQKYDWKRHEESVHFPQQEWVCMPDGPIKDSRCVFCGLQDPDYSHLEIHKSIPCSETPRTQRAFSRKDKLVQHIKQVHACPPPQDIKGWCRPIEREVVMLCGLCCQVLTDWETRAAHFASHFADGIGMEMWILEHPGGILPRGLATNENTLRFLTTKFIVVSDPQGEFACDTCSDRFGRRSHQLIHHRQAHKKYCTRDKELAKLAEIVPCQLNTTTAELEKQTENMRLTLQKHAMSGSTAPVARRSGPGNTQSGQRYVPWASNVPVSSYNSGVPHTRVASGQSWVSNPHANWKVNLYAQGRNATPRATPATTRRSGLSAASEASLSPARPLPKTPQGPETDVDIPPGPLSAPIPHPQQSAHPSALLSKQVRTIAQRVGENAKTANVPGQGMLHSLEQLDSTAPWPSPYERER